jgi:hypothetical protein
MRFRVYDILERDLNRKAEGATKMENKENGFKVADRRFSHADGTSKEAQGATILNPEKTGQSTAAETKPPSGGTEYTPLTFLDLVLSLSTTAMLQLGLMANPQSGKAEQDLAGAKQTIDILELLKEKTVGNLSEEESHLLESSLFDLKMMFLKVDHRIQT